MGKRENNRKTQINLFIIPTVIGAGLIINHLGNDYVENKKAKEMKNKYTLENDSLDISLKNSQENEQGKKNINVSESLESEEIFEKIDFVSLKRDNADTVAWLSINGVIEDYPIVQTNDNSYYVNHDFYGNNTKAGTIFEDYRNASLESEFEDLSKLTLVYGHHMKNNTMFANICNYKDDNYVEEHPYGLLYTPDGDIYKIEFFAGINLSGNESSFLDIENYNQIEFNEYINTIKENSSFDNDLNIEYEDKLIALVTCSYEKENNRYILYGKLSDEYIKQEEQEYTKVLKK